MDNYHNLGKIGEGSFGQVFKGRRRATGQITAMKFISKSGRSRRDLRSLEKEIEILRKLKHENIIQMLDTYETEHKVCVITEFAQGELFEILQDDKSLPEPVIQRIAKQLVRALFYLHSNSIIHRDMKPQNVLVGANGTIKLCDFGFARALSENTLVAQSIKGTPLYMAPELVQERPYNHTVDLWSLGVILYELFTGEPPFYTDNIVTLMNKIIRNKIEFPAKASPNFCSFLRGLLNKDPTKRLDWPELLHHPFVLETDKERVDREQLLHSAATRAEASRAWKGEGGAIAGAAAYAGKRAKTPVHGQITPPLGPSVATPPMRQVDPSDNNLALPAVPKSAPPARIAAVPTQVTPELKAKPLQVAAQSAGLPALGKTAKPQGKLVAAPRGPSLAHGSALKAIATRIIKSNLDVEAAIAVCKDGSTVDGLLQLLHVPSHASGNGTGSADVVEAATAAGKLLGLAPFTSQAANLHSALIRLLSACMSTSLSDKRTAISIMAVVGRAEQAVTAAIQDMRLPQPPFVAFKDSLGAYSNLLEAKAKGLDDDCDYQLLSLIARALGAVLHRLQLALHFDGVEARDAVEDAVDNTVMQVPKILCTALSIVEGCTEGNQAAMDASAQLIMCMMHVVHCEKPQNMVKPLAGYFPVSHALGQGSVEVDLTSRVFLMRHSQGASLANSSGAQHLLRTALTGQDVGLRNAALLVLLHTCRDQPLLSTALVRCGLVGSLMRLTKARACPTILKARCYWLLGHLVGHAKAEGTLTEPVRGGLQAQQVTQELVEALKATEQTTVLIAPMLATLAGYSLLLNQPPPMAPGSVQLPSLSPECYSPRVLDAVAGLLKVAPGDEPAMTAVEGLPVRTGLLDSAFRCIYALGQADDSSAALGSSTLVAVFVEALTCAHSQLLDASPGGVLLAIKSLAMFAHLPGHVRILAADDVLDRVLALLSPEHLTALTRWPTKEGGSKAGCTLLLENIMLVLNQPFVLSEAGKLDPAVMPIYLDQLAKRDVPKLLQVTFSMVDAHQESSMMLLLSRMLSVSDNRLVEVFAEQYIRAGGMTPAFMQRMLHPGNPSVVLVRTLMIISQLARRAKVDVITSMANSYELIHKAGIYESLRKLITHSDPQIRMRVCNVIGNLCRHSGYFYPHLEQNGFLPMLVERFADSDPDTRKFACFAYGNAAFHNNSLYCKMAVGVLPLVRCLADSDPKTRLNAAGALGNLVRNGDALLQPILEANAVLELLRLILRNDTDTLDGRSSPRGTALFALVKLSVHPAVFTVLEELHCEERVVPYLRSTNREVQTNAERLIEKLRLYRGAVTRHSGVAGR